MGKLNPIRCEWCRYWRSILGKDGEYERGECRRYAPRAGSSPVDDPHVAWPETHYDDWCGDYDESFQGCLAKHGGRS